MHARLRAAATKGVVETRSRQSPRLTLPTKLPPYSTRTYDSTPRTLSQQHMSALPPSSRPPGFGGRGNGKLEVFKFCLYVSSTCGREGGREEGWGGREGGRRGEEEEGERGHSCILCEWLDAPPTAASRPCVCARVRNPIHTLYAPLDCHSLQPLPCLSGERNGAHTDMHCFFLCPCQLRRALLQRSPTAMYMCPRISTSLLPHISLRLPTLTCPFLPSLPSLPSQSRSSPQSSTAPPRTCKESSISFVSSNTQPKTPEEGTCW